ncbi:WD40-repeat containing protein [Gracilaria domingensis]|nr:WD40-repeat containing protein [Gracilaria domingensis]
MPDFAKSPVQALSLAPKSNLLAAQTTPNSFSLAQIAAPSSSPQAFHPRDTWSAPSLASLCLASEHVLYHADSRGAFHRHALADAPSLQYSVDAAHTGHELTSVTATSPHSVVVTAGKDGAVRCWDPETRQCTAKLAGHRYEVRSVAASASSDVDDSPVTVIASGGRDKTIRLWDVRTDSSTQLHTFKGHTSWVHSVALTANPTPLLVSCAGDKTVRVWDLVAMKERAVFRGHEYRVWSVAISPDGRFAVSGSTDATVRLWKLGEDEGRTQVLEGHRDSVLSVAALTPACVISGCEDGSLYSWNCRGLLDIPTDAELLYTNSELLSASTRQNVSAAVEDKSVGETIADESNLLIHTEPETSTSSPTTPKHFENEVLTSEKPAENSQSSSTTLTSQETDTLKTAVATTPQKDPRFDKSAAELVNALKRIQNLEKSLQRAERSLGMKETQIAQLNKSVAEKDLLISRLQGELSSSKRLLQAANVRNLLEQNPRKADVALDYQEPVNKIGAVTDQLSALKARLDAMIATN